MTHRRRRSILALGVVWLLIADVATAGEYVLVLGKGIEVCEAFLKNLNSFPGEPPMVCERKVNPKFPEFSKPTWQPLDAMERLDLLEQIERLSPSYREEEYMRNREKLIEWLKEHIGNGRIQLAWMEVDIDKDGIQEVVLQHTNGECDPANELDFSHSIGRRLYVLNSDKRKIDPEKSSYINFLGRADIFLFKRRVYLTQWGLDLVSNHGTVLVRPPLVWSGQPSQCDYHYKASKTRRQP